MKVSEWKTLLLDYNRASDGFTDEDVDRFTELLDLGEAYEFLTVLIPALDSSGTVSVRIQKDEKVTTNPVALHGFLDADGDNTILQATTSGAGSIAVTFRIGGAQYLRLYVSADQSANRTFYVKGFNREPMD